MVREAEGMRTSRFQQGNDAREPQRASFRAVPLWRAVRATTLRRTLTHRIHQAAPKDNGVCLGAPKGWDRSGITHTSRSISYVAAAYDLTI
eukprot:2822121-Prymnesium_polylepis.1